MPLKDSRILIVGGGVFGLSTALWLARAGYRDLTIFDRCDLENNHYDPDNGCDGASADINKIFRATYGAKEHYQNLAMEAKAIWLEWNEAIRKSTPSELPASLSPDDKLLDVCGLYHLGFGKAMQAVYAESLEVMAQNAPEFRALQFVKHNTADAQRVRRLGSVWEAKFHFLDELRNGDTHGYLDIECGITLADKACTYAQYLCKRAGVKFILGNANGKVEKLIIVDTGVKKRVTGVKTFDGKDHEGDLVVVASGGWTASLIPEAHRTVETTGGTVMFIDVPKERQDLRARFDSSNFPITRFVTGEGDSAYEGSVFPITQAGRIKFGFRGRKFTNFRDHPTEKDLRISTPRTRYTQESIDTVPLHGLNLMKKVIGEVYPELKEIGFTDSRLCWYTDSIDNELVIDYVPGYSDSLFICTGGSGHSFKFLPVLGKYVQHQLERVTDQFTDKWKWRVVEGGKKCNGLEEGETGPRDMSKLQMASPEDFKFD